MRSGKVWASIGRHETRENHQKLISGSNTAYKPRQKFADGVFQCHGAGNKKASIYMASKLQVGRIA